MTKLFKGLIYRHLLKHWYVKNLFSICFSKQLERIYEMDLLTVEEVAKLLKAHTNTVYKMCRQGRLPSVKIGKKWRIDKQKLVAFMQAEENMPEETGINSLEMDFKPGHTLVLTKNREDIWDYEVSFFKENSQKGYLLYKGCWWQKPEQVRKMFTERGLPVAKLEAGGGFAIDDLTTICKQSGPLAAADAWRSRVHWALKNGYKGMIGCGAPIVAACESEKDFFTFEEALDGFLDGLPVKGMCAYYLEGSQSLNWDSAVKLMNIHGQVVFRTKAMDVVAEISKKYTRLAQ